MTFCVRSKKVVLPFLSALFLFALMVMSLSWVFGSYFQPFGENWGHLIDNLLASVMMDTLLLLLFNSIGCLFLGVSLAWLVCRYEFHGRKWLQWLLILPLSMPPYVTAFILFDVFDSSGELNQQINDFWNLDISVDLQNIGYTSLAMIMVFYPYVYWVVRSSLLSIRGNLLDSATNLGLSEVGLFWRVIIPMIKNATMGGLSLVMLETLADFGAVSIFNVDTLSTLIYKMWYSFFDLRTALQVSGLLLLIVLVLYLFSQLLKSKGLTHNLRQGSGIARVELVGWKKWMASGFCWGIVLISFIVPVAMLIWMSSSYVDQVEWVNFIEVLYNTLLIGGGASLLLVSVSALLVIALHQLRNDYGCCTHQKVSRIIDRLCAFLRLGYAFPGSVVAMSLVGIAVYIDNVVTALGMSSLLIGGSLLLLFWAYMIRFFAVSLNALNGSINHLSGNLSAIAMNLGLSQWKIKRKVYFPNLKIPIIGALVLVFIEVIKEMPATLMLRPAGWETLAVNIYSYTAEGEWIKAAMPALSMVFLCAFFMLITFQKR